jgi:phosphate transport system permease protein
MQAMAARGREGIGRRRAGGDAAAGWVLRGLAAVVPLLTVGIGVQLYRGSAAARQAFGWGFVSSSTWDPVFDHFGAWPFLFGTLFTTAIAVALAAPLGTAVAIFLAEVAPKWLRSALGGLVDLLAVVPSVVYGLWGMVVMVPWLRQTVEPWLGRNFSALPLFQGPPYGVGFLAAGLVLALMVLPFVVSLAREAMQAVPRAQREAGLALGATRWEVIRHIVLPGARGGIGGGILLAVGRALGETMAVTMLIGNRPAVSGSLFAPGYTLASVIANEFTEATSALYTASLVELGLILFGLTLLVNLAARLLLRPREAGA